MPRLRSLLDLLWIAAFAAIVLWMQLRPSAAGSADGSLPLDLRPGEQRQGLYRHGVRLGTVTFTVRRAGKSWRVHHRFELGTGSAQRAAEVAMQLRADLSLARVRVDADLEVLAQLAGLPPLVLRELGSGGAARLRLQGDCVSETGVCQLVGALGRRQLSFPVTAGRGPVIMDTIYPLLARGSLGRKAEVTVFDPLSLRQHVVAFRIEGRERLRPAGDGASVSGAARKSPGPLPPSGVNPLGPPVGVNPLGPGIAEVEAIRVTRDLAGLTTRVWIDDSGKVLREEMPLGFTLEHESWRPL
jgi:hypothetical protein